MTNAVDNMTTGGEDVIVQRQSQLMEVSKSLALHNSTLNKILAQTGWNLEDLQAEQAVVQCPVNSNHHVPVNSLQVHTERCKWVSEGYSKKEQEEAVETLTNTFFYEKAGAVCPITLDRKLPRTMERLETEFSTEERRSLYDHVMERCQAQRQGTSPLHDYDVDMHLKPGEEEDDGAKRKSHLEVLAEMRDYRRRRQSYRAKNVHITKKSNTEVMREIINAHMKFLEDSNQTETHEDGKAKEKPQRDRSPGSSTSRSSSQSRWYKSRNSEESFPAEDSHYDYHHHKKSMHRSKNSPR